MSANSENDPEFNDGIPKSRSGGLNLVVRLFIVLGIVALLVAFMLPAIRTAGPAARRAQCANNLKQIALALLNYEQQYRALPPAYTVDARGRPLHSWRTLILPYLEEEPLYRTIDLSKPWNDPANAKAYETSVYAFRCPGAVGARNATAYLAVVGRNGCFTPEKPRRMAEITDGTATTLMVIETGEENAVPWMEPVDANESLIMSFGRTGKLHHAGGANACFVDGSVRFLKGSVPPEVRRALMSISGQDNVSSDQY
jgi:prepilin-type processing-associated H-X9-DG protein